MDRRALALGFLFICGIVLVSGAKAQSDEIAPIAAHIFMIGTSTAGL